MTSRSVVYCDPLLHPTFKPKQDFVSKSFPFFMTIVFVSTDAFNESSQIIPFVLASCASWARDNACVTHQDWTFSRAHRPLEVPVTRLGCCLSYEIWKEARLLLKASKHNELLEAAGIFQDWATYANISSLTTT